MSMIKFKHRGSFTNTERFFNHVLNRNYLNVLDEYGRRGVEALRKATPIDSGKTADSWDYEISRDRNSTIISFINTNVNDGVNIAIILQYGHGTGTGGFVKGRDFINPAIQPIFDDLAEQVWKEVTAK